MVHPDREFTAADVGTAEELIVALRRPGLLQAAFRLVNTWFLNDSASPYGPQVYVVVRDGIELDALEVSVCHPDELRDWIYGILTTSTYAYPGVEAGPTRRRPCPAIAAPATARR